MENYIVSARKYRPATFASVVGQPALTATLKNAIATDRLAHAYLFCGSRGVGKTSCARIFAKTINCACRTADGEACNECDSCRAFNENRSLNILELDAASNNGVDSMHQLIEQVQVPPTQGRYRVFIVDEVHMLSTGAFNAFLKTLEEPPAHAIFILATTEKHKIIPTILSRCQIYDFNRITIPDMVSHLQYVARQEGIAAEPAALNVIARQADGAMRDALSIFDQVAASSRGNITYQSTIENLNVLDTSYYDRLLDAFLAQDVESSLLIYKEIRDKGFDSHFFITGLGDYLRDLMVASNPATAVLLEAPDDERQAITERAKRCTPQFLYQAMALCNDADLNYRTVTNKQFLVELTLIRLCQRLSPSPNKRGKGEGLLRSIAKPRSAAPAASQPAATPKVAAPKPPVTPSQAAMTPATIPSVAAMPLPKAGIAVPKPARVLQRSHSMSIASLSDASKPTPADGGAPTNLRSNAFALDDIKTLWCRYIDDNPHSHVLIAAMRDASLDKVEGCTCAVTVHSGAQAAALNDNLDGLMAYLRHGLRNDAISLDIKITDAGTSPLTWSEKELLQHIIEQNPGAKEFIEAMQMSFN